jgi:FG-GAP-like repeat
MAARGSRAGIAFLLLAALGSPAAAQPCTGNCDADDRVAVGEIVVGVNLALGLLPLTACPIFDRDGNGAIQIDELIVAIDFSLRGCPATPVPTASSTPTTSPTIPDPLPSPTATPTDVPTAAPGRIEGQFEVVGDFFGEGAGERQTVIGDCNGDGLLDAIRLQWGVNIPPKLYVQDPSGTFVGSELGEGLPHDSGTFADLDGDGLQDVVLSGQSVFVLRGHGDCTFDAARMIGQACEYPIVQTLVTDVDLDGLADLSLSCIGAQPTEILLARGDGDYELVSPQPAVPSDAGYPMFGTLYDDFDGDGTRDLLMMVDQGKSWFSWATPDDLPRYAVDETLTQAIDRIDPMGVALLDYDRDGNVEYFLSGTVRNLFYRNGAGRNLTELAGVAGIAINSDATSFSPYAFDVNLDGWTDILVIRKGGFRPEDEHPVRPYLFINQGNGTFRDAGEQAIDTPIFSTMMTCGDLAGDGRVACFAGDPRGTFLLRNRVKPAGNWVGVRLRGTVSSPEAAGARVSVDGASPPLVVATGQSPAWGEHSRDVILAIGERPSATLSIVWPSGIVQRAENLAAGTYATVTETKALTVSSRVAPADGETVVDVVVDLDAIGATSASIEREGAGTWVGPATLADGMLHRGLRAPANAGSARIEVRLDAVALRVRPRIRFENTSPAPGGTFG